MSDAAEREYEYRKQRYDSYVKERDGLRDASLQISERYDKWMLVLSGGALALSLTFIEKVAPHPLPWSFAVLLVAWILLIVSVVLELHALATSQRALTEQVSLLDREYQAFLNSLSSPNEIVSGESIGAPVAAENEFAARTRVLNAWSLRAFIAGIVFLCIFSAANLPYRQEQKDMASATRERLSKGSFVPPGNILPPPPPPVPQSPPPTSVPATPQPPPQR